jgi:hypothetical protein
MKGQRILGSNEKQWPMKKKINGHRFGLKIIIFFRMKRKYWYKGEEKTFLKYRMLWINGK